MPVRLLEGRILHVSGTLNAAYNTFENMTVGDIELPNTLSGEEESGDCTFGDARLQQR